MGVLPNMFPGYQDVTDPAVRQKFADAWGIDATVMDDRVGTRITEVPHLALEGKVKAYYIMGKIRCRPRPTWAWCAAALRRSTLWWFRTSS